MHGVRIVDRRLNVVISKKLEWLDAVDDSSEDLVEDVVDARATDALLGYLVNKAAVNLLVVELDELVDQVEHDRALVTAHAVLLNLQLHKLALLLLQM